MSFLRRWTVSGEWFLQMGLFFSSLFRNLSDSGNNSNNHDAVGPIRVHSSCYTFFVAKIKFNHCRVNPNQNRESSLSERTQKKFHFMKCKLSDLCWFRFYFCSDCFDQKDLRFGLCLLFKIQSFECMLRLIVWFVYVYLLARAAALAILHHRIDAPSLCVRLRDFDTFSFSARRIDTFWIVNYGDMPQGETRREGEIVQLTYCAKSLKCRLR